MRTLVRVLLYDVVLATIHILVDAWLIYSYVTDGDTWWAVTTITAVCLPGLLELLTYTYSFLHGDLSGVKEYIFWGVCFGPLLFPISLVVWHGYQVYKGEKNFKKYENTARSRVLTSLSNLTKSALQITLQTTILMISWNKDNLPSHIYQMISVSFSLLTLAKSCADHHYFESNGKNIEAHTPYGQKIKRLLFIMIILNYIIAQIIIKSDGSKHIWTAFSAVLLPTCFASRDTFANKDPSFGKKMFAKFYRYNSVLFFFLFGVVALITTNFIIRYTDMSTFTCDNYPFLSHDPDCQKSSLLSNPIFDLPPPHSWFYFLGNLLVIVLAMLHVVLVFMEEFCIRDFTKVVAI